MSRYRFLCRLKGINFITVAVVVVVLYRTNIEELMLSAWHCRGRGSYFSISRIYIYAINYYHAMPRYSSFVTSYTIISSPKNQHGQSQKMRIYFYHDTYCTWICIRIFKTLTTLSLVSKLTDRFSVKNQNIRYQLYRDESHMPGIISHCKLYITAVLYWYQV